MAESIRPLPLPERGAVDDATFAREVVGADRPIVLRGQFEHWPAVSAAQGGDRAVAHYVGRFTGGTPIQIMVGSPEIGGRFFYQEGMEKLNFGRHHVPAQAMMIELLRLADDGNPHALYASACDAATHLPGWEEENPLDMPLSDPVARVWIGNRAQVATHYDLGSNLAVVVAGRRRFTLFPPEQLSNLYVGPLERTIAGPPVSMVDPEAPDLERYPRFAQAVPHARAAELAPGDAIFIPSLWWHHVRALGAINILVNYWPALDPTTSPLSALIHAMMSVRDLSLRERGVWRAWFEHYVFADEARTAGQHLPIAVRGFAGPGSEQRTQQMLRFLLASLQRH